MGVHLLLKAFFMATTLSHTKTVGEMCFSGYIMLLYSICPIQTHTRVYIGEIVCRHKFYLQLPYREKSRFEEENFNQLLKPLFSIWRDKRAEWFSNNFDLTFLAMQY